MASNEEGDVKVSKRQNYQNYADDDRMRDAVNHWFVQQSQPVPTDKGWLTKEQIAEKYSVNKNTLKKYTCQDSSKRRKLGHAGGREKIMSDNKINILTQFALPFHRANDGQLGAKIIQKILELEPLVTKIQANGFYHNTFKKLLQDLLDEADKQNVANILYDLATATSTSCDVVLAVEVATNNTTATTTDATDTHVTPQIISAATAIPAITAATKMSAKNIDLEVDTNTDGMANAIGTDIDFVTPTDHHSGVGYLAAINKYKDIRYLMRPLTHEEDDALSKITDVNYRQCLDGKWLKIHVIDNYLRNYLHKKDIELCKAQNGRRRSHFFDVDFINKECRGIRMFDYNDYIRFSRKVPGGYIFNLKYLFFPITINNKHWACIVVYMEEKRIRYCDSLGAGRASLRSSSRDYHEQQQKKKINWVLCYLKAEYKAKKSQDMPDEFDWNLETCINPNDAPQQDNINDCGVFVCMFCEFVLNGCTLCFSQEMINQGQWRKKIILRILEVNGHPSTETSDDDSDSDVVEIVEPHPSSKKPSRSTRYRGSMHEEATYSCELNIASQTECPPSCQGSARKQCKNNELQKFKLNYRNDEHPLIRVARSGNKGEGVFAKKLIKKGTFIAEYVGKRLKHDDPKTMSGHYVMRVDQLYLDAEGVDSYAGSINHGCQPNCIIERWIVDEGIRAKVIASKDIRRGLELTFDYKWNRTTVKCYCGSKRCRGYL